MIYNASFYVFVPDAEITQAMVNRSTSHVVSECPQTTILGVSHCMLEVKKTDIVLTDVFDGYTWHEIAEAKQIKDNPT